MRRIYVAEIPAQVHLIQGLLESHGIETLVEGAYLFEAIGPYGHGSGVLPSVYVAEADAERALEIIRSRQPAEDAPDPAPVPAPTPDEPGR